MHALNLSFAPPSPWARRLARSALALGLTLSLALAALCWRDVRALQELRSRHAAERSAQQAKEAESLRQQAAAGAPKPYQKEAERLMHAASFPMQGVLHALETNLRPGLRLTQLELKTTEASLHMEVEYQSQAELLSFVDALNAGDPGRPWQLLTMRNANGSAGLASVQAVWPSVLPGAARP